jgi:hypothetical protein
MGIVAVLVGEPEVVGLAGVGAAFEEGEETGGVAIGRTMMGVVGFESDLGPVLVFEIWCADFP